MMMNRDAGSEAAGRPYGSQPINTLAIQWVNKINMIY